MLAHNETNSGSYFYLNCGGIRGGNSDILETSGIIKLNAVDSTNFVSFTSHLESDTKMLIKNLNSSHSNYKMIKAYLLKSAKISEADKKKIQ